MTSDLKTALSSYPNDPSIKAEWEELKNLVEMPDDQRRAWLDANRGVDLSKTLNLTWSELQEWGSKIRAECDSDDM